MRHAADDHPDFAALASRVRVSDRDRELAARRLRDAASAGVLSVTELDWRLDRALSAATRGELEFELFDLPVPRRRRRSRLRRWLGSHVATFVIVNTGLTAIWAASGSHDFWPVWPMIGWGMVIAGHAYSAHSSQASEDLRPDC